MNRRLLAAPLAVVVLAGCSYNYVPRKSPRVSLVMDGGKLAYVKDGRIYDGSWFGGDIDEVVRGNPVAEEHARAFKTGMIGGFVVSLLGTGAFIGGTVMALPNYSDSGNRTTATIGTGMLLGGVALMLAGSFWMMSAQPHLYDAINAYNDGVGP